MKPDKENSTGLLSDHAKLSQTKCISDITGNPCGVAMTLHDQWALVCLFAIRIRRRSAILNLIKLKFFMVYPYLKLHILFNSNAVAIWSGFPDITHIKKIMADNRPP